MCYQPSMAAFAALQRAAHARATRAPGASSRRRAAGRARAAFACALVASAPAAAADDPTLTLRDRAQIDLDPLAWSGGELVIAGEIVSRTRGAPIADAALDVAAGDRRERVRSGPAGRFEARLATAPGSPAAPRPPGRSAAPGARAEPAEADRAIAPDHDDAPAEGPTDIRVAFAGSERHAAAAIELQGARPEARPLAIELDAPEQFVRALDSPEPAAPDDGAARGPRVAVRATSGGAPAEVEIALWAGPDPESAEPVTTAELADGERSLVLPERALVPAGPTVLIARRPGEGDYQPAQVEATIEVRAETSLELALREAGGRARSKELRVAADAPPFRAEGTLRGAFGAPHPGALIELRTSAGRPLAIAATDAEGSFSTTIAPTAIGADERPVFAVYEPTHPWIEPAHSPPVAVAIDPDDSVPLSYTAAALGAALLLGGGISARRLYPIRAGRERGAGAAPGGDRDGRENASQPGIATPGGPRLGTRLFSPRDVIVEGVAIDASSKLPIASATIRATRVAEVGAGGEGPADDDDRAVVAETDSSGRFRAELGHGAWHLAVTAPGYVRERVELTLPHRGELRDMRAALWPVREWMLARFFEVAQPLIAPGERRGAQTPRQIAGRLPAGESTAAIRRLARSVEMAYFSPRPPDEDDVGAFEALATEASRQVAAARGGPPGVGARGRGSDPETAEPGASASAGSGEAVPRAREE